MNNGKICISVCASTVEELLKKMALANETADIIEVRFDCLSPAEFDPQGQLPPEVLEKILAATRKPILTTFRTKDQGGRRDLSDEERKNFWSKGYETDLCDLEEDIVEDSWYWLWGNRICSYHDFSGTPNNIESIFDRLAKTDAEIIKIAVQTNDITETISVWKLIGHARQYRQISRPKVIPIAMGEPGKWTRILGLAHGAYLTYASLETGSETAPGQVTADDLINVYKAKEIDESTEIFGVIAGNTSYSMSPYIHNAAFGAANMNRVFVPMQVGNIDEFMRRMVKPETREIELNFRGFAVTNPHKQTVIKYLDEIDATAAAIGAVNTIKIADGKLYGYNTDAVGFIEPLKARFPDLKGVTVAMFGAGGAARACVYALKQNGADVTLFVRDTAKAAALADEFGIETRGLPSKDAGSPLADFDILVNATPLGTKGVDENRTVAFAQQLSTVKLVYDLIYNPTETLLIREARKADVHIIGGLEMLIEQAEQQYRIWTGSSGAGSVMREAALKRLKQ
ncbi:MAG: shikimate dehydrogenase [Acidobacteria bacterium]|nr:shikimate dehydrogenase [Acidobacteriota bacterium]